MTHATLPSTAEAFDRWLALQRSSGTLQRPSSERVYAGMWHAYCGWLTDRQLDWLAVQPTDWVRFFNGPAPGQHNRRKPRHIGRMSSYTRQRYWRLLTSVYTMAVIEQWCPAHPGAEMSVDERPTVDERSRSAQILPPRILSALRDPAVLDQIFPLHPDAHWVAHRDRAALELLAHTGLTSSEFIALQGRDIAPQCLQHRQRSSALVPTEPPRALQLTIRQTGRDTVARSIELPDHLWDTLCQWHSRRQQMLQERQSRQGPLSARSAFLHSAGDLGPLFPSRQSDANGPTAAPLPPMKPQSLHLMVGRALNALYQLPAFQEIDPRARGTQVARGTAILRNSLIRHWLDTLGTSTTLTLAGLKNENSLRLLAKPSQGSPL